MGNMKALVYYGPGDMRIETRPIPNLDKGDVLIKVRAVSVCGSDLGAYRIHEVNNRWKPPIVLGHEFSGIIAALGEGVEGLYVGQRVTANPILYCGECYYCQRGMINLCTKRHNLGTSIGGEAQDGAMQEYMSIRASAVIPLLEGVTFEQGALLEPLSVTYCAAKLAMQDDGERVCVVGAGPIGLMIIKFLKAFGAQQIYISDIVKNRLEKALEIGADAVLDAHRDVPSNVMKLTGGIGVDRVILSADAPNIVTNAFEMVRNGGNIVFVALMHNKITIDPMEIVGRAINLLGSYMFTDDMTKVMALLQQGKFQVNDIITSIIPFEESEKIFSHLCSIKCRDIKVIINMDE